MDPAVAEAALTVFRAKPREQNGTAIGPYSWHIWSKKEFWPGRSMPACCDYP